MSELQVGDQAPNFTLPSTAGGEIELASFRGQSSVLLAFFPLAFTGVCTGEMCDFSHDLAKFNEADAKVFGVSVDSIPTLNEFRQKNGIAVDLLSDFKREVSRSYGVLLEDKFFAKRAYFIVDRNGTVAWFHIEAELGNKRDNSELLAKLGELP
ncbi:MAG: redoxin domain-containing protein [Gemmatimonadales bacterium]